MKDLVNGPNVVINLVLKIQFFVQGLLCKPKAVLLAGVDNFISSLGFCKLGP